MFPILKLMLSGGRMNETSKALQRITWGMGVIFAGTIILTFFGFLNRAIIARYFSTSEYGVFNLVLTVLSIALVIATLGFESSLPREVAIYEGRKPSQLEKLVSTAVTIVVLTSLSLVVLLFFGAGSVARIFHDERLEYPMRIIAIVLPFSALKSVLVSISRGFGRVREKVYFQNVIYPVTFFVLILIGTRLKVEFSYIFLAYVVAQALTLFLLLFDVVRVGLVRIKPVFVPSLGKELLMFSIPLMLTGILGFIMNWTDTLMLGYYLTSEVVGIYNAAAPLAKMLPIFLTSAGFLYMPITSQLYAQGKFREMGTVYQILTKWVFLLTLPAFVIMFLFPEALINFVFGAKYLEASTALQILSAGFMLHVLLGLNEQSLIVIGETNLTLIADLFAGISNVFFNVFLIPNYEINGAAIATVFSYFVANIFKSYWLYRKTGIHPFSWNYVKSLVICFVLFGVINLGRIRVLSIWYAFLILLIFSIVYFFLVLLSKSLDEEDVGLLLKITQNTGIARFQIIKKLILVFRL